MIALMHQQHTGAGLSGRVVRDFDLHYVGCCHVRVLLLQLHARVCCSRCHDATENAHPQCHRHDTASSALHSATLL